jgi:hypothetical protein
VEVLVLSGASKGLEIAGSAFRGSYRRPLLALRCDCRLDTVKQALEHTVVKRLDLLAPRGSCPP